MAPRRVAGIRPASGLAADCLLCAPDMVGVTVQFPAGPVTHLLRPGLPAEHDALPQERRQRHRVVNHLRLDLREQTICLWIMAGILAA